MKYKLDDIKGQKWYRLTAIDFVKLDKHGHQVWLFECDCKIRKEIRLSSVISKSSDIKSCGCLNKEIVSYNTIRKNTTHGLSRHRLYRIWKSMKSRCYNINYKDYHYYGGKDIIICDIWLNNFQEFYNWSMSNGYEEDLSIDRINNSGNYEPENCRWVTMKIQANNRG